MRLLSMVENLNILKDIIASSALYLVLLIVGGIIVLFISTTTRMNASFKRKFYVMAYLAVIVTIGVIYYKDLTTMSDYLVNNLFVVFSFPNLAAYLVGIVVTNIILWNTTLNGKETTSVKIINSIVFVIIHYLLILLLMVIKDNKLDVFSQKSIYANEQALTIITLSSVVFISWIVFTIIYQIVRKYIYNKKGLELNQVIVYSNAEVKNKKKSNSPIKMTEAPSFIRRPYVPKPAIAPTVTSAQPVIIPLDQKPVYQKPKVIVDMPLAEKIVETEKPKVKPKKSKELLAYEESLTLEDYKLLLNLLKAEKEKRKEQVRDVVIENDKKYEEQEENSIQSKLGELQDLYKSVS